MPLHPSIEVLRKPMRKDTVTPSRAIYTEAHYAILCVVEISHVSSYKTKHNASSILPKVESVLPDSAAKIRTISGMAKYYGSFLSHRSHRLFWHAEIYMSHRNSQKSRKVPSARAALRRRGENFCDFRDFCVTKIILPIG